MDCIMISNLQTQGIAYNHTVVREAGNPTTKHKYCDFLDHDSHTENYSGGSMENSDTIQLTEESHSALEPR